MNLFVGTIYHSMLMNTQSNKSECGQVWGGEVSAMTSA